MRPSSRDVNAINIFVSSVIHSPIPCHPGHRRRNESEKGVRGPEINENCRVVKGVRIYPNDLNRMIESIRRAKNW